MERRLLALEIPKEVKHSISRLFFGLESVKWLEAEELYVNLCQVGLDDSSFDLDLMERLFSLRLPEIMIKMNGLSADKKGQLLISLDPSEHLTKLKKDLLEALKPIPLKFIKSPEDLHIPIADLDKPKADLLAEWLLFNQSHFNLQFNSKKIVLLKPQITPKHKFYIKISYLALVSKAL